MSTEQEERGERGEEEGGNAELSPADRALLRLAQARLSDDGDPWSALLAPLDEAARALGIGRIGIWLLADDREALRAYIVVQPSRGEVFEGTVLLRRDFPQYFAALDERRVIVAGDAVASPLTAELRSSYLAPLGIGALLDAPIYRDGVVIGVACLEHMDGARAWADGERVLALSIAHAYTRLATESARQQAEDRMNSAHAQFERLERLAALARLSAGVAHDFRNVLQAVGSLTQLLQADRANDALVQEVAGEIHDAVRRGGDLVHDLLTFGREDSATPALLDVGLALEDMQRMLAFTTGAGVTLELQVEHGMGRVLMARKDLERVLVNLVLNARDALAGSGRVRIAVKETRHQQSARHHTTWIEIAVHDSGPGIEPAIAARLFEPFFTTKGERGTGLGLAIVDQLVRAAGGEVLIDSQPGSGSTFRILLPRLAPAD